MKNKLLKHDVHALSDGSLVIYLSEKTIFLESFRDIYDSFAPRKIVAWIMTPKHWDAFVDIVLDGDNVLKQQGHWRYRNCLVYRGKLKTRIKQLEEEIKHKEQMKANAALDPMNTVTLDKFDKHSAKTEKVYITGGNLEKLKPKMDKIREASRNKHKQGAELWAGENPLTKRDAFISKLSSSPKYQSALINVSFTLGFLLGAAFITAVVLIANLL